MKSMNPQQRVARWGRLIAVAATMSGGIAVHAQIPTFGPSSEELLMQILERSYAGKGRP